MIMMMIVVAARMVIRYGNNVLIVTLGVSILLGPSSLQLQHSPH